MILNKMNLKQGSFNTIISKINDINIEHLYKK